jgi:hypothetical protein
MEALGIVFAIVMIVAPYGILFIKEGNFRIRLLMVSMAALSIFSLLWIAVYTGWGSLSPVALTYSFCMTSVVILNFCVILLSWLASLLSRWT